jgi:hypothetical protein
LVKLSKGLKKKHPKMKKQFKNLRPWTHVGSGKDRSYGKGKKRFTWNPVVDAKIIADNLVDFTKWVVSPWRWDLDQKTVPKSAKKALKKRFGSLKGL